jgi:hypothetical protein
MTIRGYSTLALAALLLSGCGMMKQKAAEYYLGKARKEAAVQNPGQAALEAAFYDIDRAAGYAPVSEQVVATLEDLADASSKAGFAKGQELEAATLKKILALAPLNWQARGALTNFYASRGDLAGLDALGAQAQQLGSSANSGVRYCAMLSALSARASALPWLESAGAIALGKTPDSFLEKTAAYADAAAKLPAMKAEAEKLAASDPSVKTAAPAELVSAAEVAAADALRSPETVARVLDFNAKVGADKVFRKAVEMTIQGNAALGARDYSQARAFFQGALNQYPDLLDAKRQLAETDFQEGAKLAAAGGDQKGAAQLLYRAYAGAGEVIAAASKSGNVLPFIKQEKFLGEVYALKAADLAALRAVEGKKLRNTAKLEADFKASLDEAVRLNPEGSLASQLLERYSKEGF